MKIILLSKDPEDKKFFESAAKVAGFQYQGVAQLSDAVTCLKENPKSVAVVDVSNPAAFKDFEKAVSEQIGVFSELLNPNNLYFISSSSFHEVPILAQSDIFGHFIQRNFTEQNVAILAALLRSSSSDRPLNLEQFLDKNVKSQVLKVTKSNQKKPLIESLKSYLLKIGFKSRMAVLIATAADELVMNAFFDAPVDQLGKHTYAQTPRDSEINLDDKHPIELKIAFDNSLLAISVTDSYGSVDKKKLLNQHLGRSYESREYETKTVVAGAGLGLAHIYRNSGGMIIACESGIRTEVSLFFKKTDSFREFKDQFRFLSTFMYFNS